MKTFLLSPSLGLLLAALASAQPAAPTPAATVPGTPEEPVRVLNGQVDLDRHDGGLSPVVGVETIQVLRANRAHPDWAEGFGFCYNHAPMISAIGTASSISTG